MDEHNPTLPVAFDITALVVALLWLVLVVAVLGALAWLLMGNKPGAADMRSDSPPR